jgi:glutathione synthase/RimK-type ligase-like ATP-grasp enzyme
MRVALSIHHGLGIPVFPNWQTVWHFDDKLSQKYLLDAAGVPSPDTRIFYEMNDALAYCKSVRYPVVVKLTGGICSENVRKVETIEEAEHWVTRMFSTGLTTFEGWPRPSLLGQSRKRLGLTRQAALGRSTVVIGNRSELQHGYILLQEFVPGNSYDTRITVIGDRAFAFRRFNRDGDFRASGSGKIDWDPQRIEWRKVALAFEVARKLGTQSLAVDIFEARDGSLLMNEISYYYEGWAVAACPGHWRPHGAWQEGSVAPEDAIFEDFITLVQSRQRQVTALAV